MAGVRAEEPDRFSGHSHARVRPVYVGFAVAAFAVLLVFVLWPTGGTSAHDETPLTMGAHPPTPPLSLAKASLLLSQPLDAEVQALAQDARSALDLLSRNFLPTP